MLPKSLKQGPAIVNWHGISPSFLIAGQARDSLSIDTWRQIEYAVGTTERPSVAGAARKMMRTLSQNHLIIGDGNWCVFVVWIDTRKNTTMIVDVSKTMSRGQAARLLEISGERISQLIHEGRLRTIPTPVGRLILIEDVEKVRAEMASGY